MKTFRNPAISATLAALIGSLPATAVEIDRNSPRAELLANTGMGLKTGPGEGDVFSWRIRTPLGPAAPLGDTGRLGYGVAYEGTALRFDGTAAAFPLPDADLHELSLQLVARFQRPETPWSFTLGLTPGIASDFDHVDGDDFFLGGRIVWERVVNDSFKLGFGAAVIRSLGSDTVLPAAGFEWRPADAWLVELAGPFFNVWWQPDDAWLARFAAGPAGGVWNVDWNNLSRDLAQSSYLVGLAVEHRIGDSLWLGAGLGVSLANRIELTTTGGLTTWKSGLNEGLFVSLGLRAERW